MVWLHGGALVHGSGTEMYDSTILSALNDVIVVTVNYRLGLFGFFTTGKLRGLHKLLEVYLA